MTNVSPSDLVLIDTNLWIAFLSRSEHSERPTVEHLVRRKLAATTGMVSAEVLYGARSKEQFDRLADLFNQLHFLETTQAAWRVTADLAFTLKSQGETMQLPDLIIGAVALEHGCQLFTKDEAFHRISGLRLYEAGLR